MNKGILFDADGTLWDSAVQVAESWNEVLVRYPHLGVRIMARDVYDSMGETMMDTGKTLFPGLPQGECRKVMEERMTYENHYLLSRPEVLYPETREIMACLSRQYGLCIVSNCQSGYIGVLLESCGLRGYVRDTECYGNTGLPKGDSIRMVVQRNHLGCCFHAGDTHMDEETVGAAGIPFVHAAYGLGRAERPVGTIESLSQLTAFAKKSLDQELDMNQEECKEIKQALDLFLNESLGWIFMSNPTDSGKTSRSRVRPLFMRGRLAFQAEERAGKQAFHRNLDRDEAADYVTGFLNRSFRQAEIVPGLGNTLTLVSRKGKVTVKVKQSPRSARILPAGNPVSWESERVALPPHNRGKHYILEGGIPVPSLVDLGVMTKEGRVVDNRRDKHRQINRLLEFIEDAPPNLDQDRESTIIDFGCGKSHLTFVMYYYLKELKGYPTRIAGLDLKEDVIEYCSRLGCQYGYEGLSFCHGDIASFEEVERVDMVVTFHVCDLAADYTLEKAVSWGARAILPVPCCQHELNGQMENSLPRLVLQHGLIKGRMAVLYMDAIRAQVLEYRGYRTQILESIDMEHTPKNILIQAVRQGKKRDNGLQIRELADFPHVKPAVVELPAPELWESGGKTEDS